MSEVLNLRRDQLSIICHDDPDSIRAFERLFELALEPAPSIQTGDFTAGTSHRYLVDASGGAITVSLPSVVGFYPRGYSITKTDSSANLVIIVPDGSETILGDVDLRIARQFDSPDIFPSEENSGWYAE